MNRAAVEAFEAFLRARNRVRGVGWFPHPEKYFGAGGVEEAERRCAEANRDLLAFVRVPERLDPSGVESRPIRLRPGGESAVAFRFDSPLPSGRDGNDRVEIRVLPARSAADGSVILFHHPLYQKMWATWSWFLEPLREHAAIAMMASPYHFDRAPCGEYPGEGTVNPNPWRLFEAIRQWSWDQHAAVALLRERLGLAPLAVVGFSLGAFQSILVGAAGVQTLPIVAIAATNRYAWGIFNGNVTKGLRRGFAEVGIDPGRLTRMVESIELERYAPRLQDRPVLWIRGDWDRVDPEPSGERLEAALRPWRSVRLRAGHATVVFERRIVAREVDAFVRALPKR